MKGRALLDAVASKNEGSVEYRWLNPITHKVEPKMSFVQKVGEDVCGVGVRQRNRKGRQVVRLKTDFHMEQPIQALAQQPCAHEQHHCQRQFYNDQICSKTPPQSSGVAATTFCQPFA